jgi:peptidoglycan hydrolase CwlO-like protein
VKKYLFGKIYLILLIFCALITNLAFAADSSNQKDLQDKIKELREEISDYQDQIDAKSDQEESLQNDIDKLEKDIAKIELQIQETQLVIQNLDIDISNKETDIENTQKEADARKKILGNFLQELYEQGSTSDVEMALGSETFSDYFFQSDSLDSFQERTREIYDQYIAARDRLKRDRDELVAKKEEQMNLRAMQNDQQNTLDMQKDTKDSLLNKTQNEKEALSEEVGSLRAQLNALQSLGEPITLDQAISAAKYASKLTDVAPEFLLGVLRVESGLGTNVGGGKYKKDMNPSQWGTFKSICKSLGRDPDKMPVSKRICYNSGAKDGCGGWGGAMGPAQFMPSTWMGYKSQVEKLTGNKPADPWDLKDSLVAMGLKLAAVDGVTDGSRKAWRKAAGMYLAGSAWESYSWYSDRVLYYADGYKKIIK